MKRHYKYFNNQGFTLIELLTVIAIIGILAAIIIPTVGSVRVNANKAKTKAMFSQWALTMDLFKSEYGYYPTIATNNKLVPANFFGALTGKTYAGAAITDTAQLYGNKRKLSFYSPANGDVDTSGNLLDAFGNTDFVVFTDTDNNGVINTSDTPALALQPVTNSVGTSLTPTAATFGLPDLTTGVRAGVIFYSAGRGNNATDIVTSW
jgi:prepilin-type N-terminal cleavage/methylation domain-containing protein